MGKHTPGPWVVSRDDVSRNGSLVSVYVAHQESGMIATAFWNCRVNTDEQCRANASLIAAAPELLEALKWMVENDETNEGDVPMPEHNGMTWNEINEFWIAGLNRARAAIAKAEGA